MEEVPLRTLGTLLHLLLAHRTHTVPRLGTRETHAAPVGPRLGRRDYLSARAGARVNQVIIALVARAACPEPLRLARDSTVTHRSLVSLSQFIDHSNYFQTTIGSELFIKAACEL